MTTRLVTVARLDCRLAAHRWSFDEARAAEVDRHFAQAQRRNPALYDGPVLLGSRVAVNADSVIEIDAFETRFSRFLALRDFGHDEPVYNFFSMAAVRSCDGAFLLGEMGPDHSSAGKIYFPAGTPDPSDIRDGAVDLEASLIRELAEEAGVSAGEGRLRPGWTVVFDGRRVACLKVIDWPQPAAALLARVRAFIAAETAPELSNAHMIAGPSALDDPRLPPFMVDFLAHAFAGAQ